MTEAERYLAEKQRQQHQASNPPLPLPTVASRHNSTQHASVSNSNIGSKWLSFLNYGLLPFNGVCLLIALVMLFDKWDTLTRYGGNPAGILVGYLVDLSMIVALFFGLRQRTSWGWWLLMLFLVLKAPLGALHRFNPVNQTAPFMLFLVIGFLLICLPQLIYFYKRRSWFGVRLQNDQ